MIVTSSGDESNDEKMIVTIQGKAINSETFKFVHLLASVTFNAPYFHHIIQTIGHVINS
jgi:hypothetical protein